MMIDRFDKFHGFNIIGTYGIMHKCMLILYVGQSPTSSQSGTKYTCIRDYGSHRTLYKLRLNYMVRLMWLDSWRCEVYVIKHKTSKITIYN